MLGCAPVTGSFVWVEDYKARTGQAGTGLVIKPGDLIEVRVFNLDQMSGKARVRSDGMVTLPFVNEVEAAGHTPASLVKILEGPLKEFVNSPLVTVTVEEAKPAPVSVIGRVERPGQYPLESVTTVLQALAVSGGLTAYAKRDRIFVLRAGPPQERIRFRYEALLEPGGKASSFHLEGGDVVAVE